MGDQGIDLGVGLLLGGGVAEDAIQVKGLGAGECCTRYGCRRGSG
jgi:hypothetical protein